MIDSFAVAMALTADAWWEDRSDRATESAYLQGLREELTTTTSDLEEEINPSVESIVAIDELMNYMASEPVEAPSEVLIGTEAELRYKVW